MSNIDKQALRYGDNVLWFLNELAAYDAGDIDSGEFDVYGEDRNGLEGCSTIDVTELAADAAKLIEAAEKRIAELRDWNAGLAQESFTYQQRVAELDNSLCELLPGTQYMDPPDGGNVTPLEQVRRMIADYRHRIAEQSSQKRLIDGEHRIIPMRHQTLS